MIVMNEAENAREVSETTASPANSILATAATAWDLDLAHKEAEASGKDLVQKEPPSEQRGQQR
jgi:hypothetical protein